MVIYENRSGRCEFRNDNCEYQIITSENAFDSNEDQSVHFEFVIGTCETQIVTFAVKFANVENQFPLL